MRFLVTGASGFTGFTLCQYLLQLSCQVRAMASSVEAQVRLFDRDVGPLDLQGLSFISV